MKCGGIITKNKNDFNVNLYIMYKCTSLVCLILRLLHQKKAKWVTLWRAVFTRKQDASIIVHKVQKMEKLCSFPVHRSQYLPKQSQFSYFSKQISGAIIPVPWGERDLPPMGLNITQRQFHTIYGGIYYMKNLNMSQRIMNAMESYGKLIAMGERF